jgi:hypothetical protein
MHILFVDESGTPPKPTTNFDRERFFVIGGAIIRADAWPNIRNKLLGLKARRRIRGEFKWRYFAPGNTDGANPFKELDRTARDEVRSEIFGIMASEKGLTCLACVADARESEQPGRLVSRNLQTPNGEVPVFPSGFWKELRPERIWNRRF